jgi:hypothetical protein
LGYVSEPILKLIGREGEGGEGSICWPMWSSWTGEVV